MSEVIHGYTLLTDWKAGQKGRTAMAEKDGKTYFIKKYTSYVLPTNDGMFDEKTIEKKTEVFNAFVKVRRDVINFISPISGPGGNIIIPCDNFIEGVHYYEVTEFIRGAIPDAEIKDFLKTLPYDQKLMMMKTAAGALSAVHSAGIIHSDLKLKNILIAQNSSGNYVAKLIDFDASYLGTSKSFIGGDDAFASPELMAYVSCEDDEMYDRLLEKITYKTDIFSLGVVFHYFLTGEFPTPETLTPSMQRQKELRERSGRPVVFYSSIIAAQGCGFKFHDSITSVRLKSILHEMLDADPEKRPTAMTVLQAIKKPEPTIEPPFPEHNFSYDNAKLSSDKIVGITKIAADKTYQIWFSSGKRAILTKDEMVAKGYAVLSEIVDTPISPTDDPWEEHHISYVESVIKYRGYVTVKREEIDGVKGYKMIRKNKSFSFYTVEQLITLGYAKRNAGDVTPPPPPPTENDDPWPEHNIEFDFDQIKAKGYVGIVRREKDGKKGYGLVLPNKQVQFIVASMLVARKMARKL